MDLRSQVAADLPLASASPVRSDEGRMSIMEALDVLSSGEPQQPTHAALAELRQWVATTATPPAPTPVAASVMDTDFEALH